MKRQLLVTLLFVGALRGVHSGGYSGDPVVPPSSGMVPPTAPNAVVTLDIRNLGSGELDVFVGDLRKLSKPVELQTIVAGRHHRDVVITWHEGLALFFVSSSLPNRLACVAYVAPSEDRVQTVWFGSPGRLNDQLEVDSGDAPKAASVSNDDASNMWWRLLAGQTRCERGLLGGGFTDRGDDRFENLAIGWSIGEECRWVSTIGVTFARVPPTNLLPGDTAAPRRTSRPLWIAVTELTEDQWDRGMGRPLRRGGLEQFPMVNVSWQEATMWCQEASKREGVDIDLPTDAEWQAACQGGESAEWSPKLLPSGGARMRTVDPLAAPLIHSAMLTTPNPLGLYEMHGNAGEWTRDWWSKVPAAGVDPQGPETGDERIWRGGSIESPPAACDCVTRYSAPPDLRCFYIGFRPCVRVD